MMKFPTASRLAAIGVLVLTSIVWTVAAATGTVNGSVTHLGNPVVKARVSIESESDSSYGATTYTDKEGNFSFTGAPIGGVTLTAFDERDRVLAAGKGTLEEQGQVITLRLEVKP